MNDIFQKYPFIPVLFFWNAKKSHCSQGTMALLYNNYYFVYFASESGPLPEREVVATGGSSFTSSTV